MISFASFPEEQLGAIGMVSISCGVRPSQLFEWNDVDDWADRMIFDTKVVMKGLEVKYGRKR